VFKDFSGPGQQDQTHNDIDFILDIPVQLTVELGRTKISRTCCNWRRARWWNWTAWPASRWTCWSTAA
jgi:hypothetical protein